jgi:hypothetical protein
MKVFEATKGAFGRHETFALRYGWITKGLLALKADNTVFEQDNAVISLGVGKNMVSSIRYWLLAAQLASFERNGAQVEELADDLMFDPGWDPFLEDDATIWLVHWLIASNAQDATAWFWFFNKFHKTYFSAKELADELDKFATAEVESKFSHVTLKADVNVLLRSYCSLPPSAAQSVDDTLDCPLSNLGLMHLGTDGRYQCAQSTRVHLPVAVVGYAVLEMMNFAGLRSIPIAKLMQSDDGLAAPGAVFKLTEDALLGKVEELIVLYPDVFALRDTAGVHQLYLLENRSTLLTPDAILASHYNKMKVAQ